MVRADERLVLIDPGTPGPRDRMHELRALDATTFLPEDEDGFGASGERIPFDLGDDGRVVRMRVSGVSSWPEEDYLARRGDAWGHRSAAGRGVTGRD